MYLKYEPVNEFHQTILLKEEFKMNTKTLNYSNLGWNVVLFSKQNYKIPLMKLFFTQ